MTRPGPERSPDGAARPGRALVDDVTAVILLPATDDDTDDDRATDPHDETPDGTAATAGSVDDTTSVLAESVSALLAALEGQARRPQRVVVVGPDAESVVAGQVRGQGDAGPAVPVVVREGSSSRHEQVEAARGAAPRHDGHWFWFLTPDSRPESGALAALIGAVRRSSRVGVAGPKLVRADDPRLLRSLGHHLTPAGRISDPTGAALVDQGQLDLRQDVLGVPLPGALVSGPTLDRVGGLDPAFEADGVDGLDLSWRSHLAGSRVVVAPDAVVRQGEQGLGVVDPVRTRVRTRQLALARGSAWAAPWRALGVAVTSLLAAALLLLVKRPREAAREWADVRAVLAPARGWGARRRFGRRREVSPQDLAGLHAPRSTGWRDTLDTVGEALDPRGRRVAVEAPPSRDGRSRGGLESGPVSDDFAQLDGEATRRRRWSWPLALAVVLAAALAGWLGRDLWGGVRPSGLGVVGPELGPATTDAAGLWASATQGWRGGGLGESSVPESWLMPAAVISGLVGLLPGSSVTGAGPALAWMLGLAAPLSVVTAYLALRRSTRRRWLRAGLALGWGAAAPLTAAVGQGRVGPAMVHVLAPLLLAGLVVMASRRGGVRRTAATFATVLGVAMAAQWVPGVLVLASVAGLALLVFGRGSARWRGAVLATLPWALLLPWLPALADPLRLVGGAGATSSTALLPSVAAPWQLVLLHPGAGLDPTSWAATPLWLTVPLWLAALGALLLRGGSGRRAGVLLAAALICAAGAQVLARTSLGVLPEGHPEAGLSVVAWPGTLLSLAGAALLLAAALTLDHLLQRDPRGDAARRRLLPVAAAVAVVLPWLLGAAWLLAPVADDHALRPATDPLPAVAAEQARGPAALRTLTLEATADGSGLLVDLQGAEPEPARILRDRTAELTGAPPQAGPVEDAVSALVAGAGADEVGRAFVDLGVGYVELRADQDHPVAADLDRVAGLTRVSSPAGTVLWRMAEGDPARTRVVGPDGATVDRLDAIGPHGAAEAELSGVPDGSRLAVAEGQGWADEAVVRVDGEEIPLEEMSLEENAVEEIVPEGAAGPPLPAGDHEIAVDVRSRWLPWHLVALALGAITSFLALPFGRAETEPEEEP